MAIIAYFYILISPQFLVADL